MQAHHTTDSESSSSPTLRTPSVTDATGGAISESQAREPGRMVKVADQVAELAFDNGLQVSESIAASLLPTPRAQNPGSTSVGYGDGLNDVANRLVHGFAPKDLLPTVTTQDAKNNAGKSQFERNTLPLNAEVTLLGTPRVSAANSSTPKQVQADAPKSRIEDQVLITNWGKFEPAIRRWEKLTRVAPSPTKPDGKDGNHRLSAEFTEWMMGLPEGWVTAEDIGLKRNDQLKACGNGVVPQQAELALRILLQDTIFCSKLKVESALE